MARKSNPKAAPAAAVQFNVEDDEVLYPKTFGPDLASTKKRRESVRQRRQSAVPPLFAGAASDPDEDDDGGVRCLPHPSDESTHEDFATKIHPHIPELLFGFSEEDMAEDLMERVKTLNIDWHDQGTLTFPFKPQLPSSAAITFSGPIDAATFADLVDKHPDEMFNEIRMAYIVRNSQKSQSFRFYQEAAYQSQTVDFVDNWALHLSNKGLAILNDLALTADELKATKAQLIEAQNQAADDNAVDKLSDALADIHRLQEDVDNKDTTIAVKDVEILKLKEKLADLIMSHKDTDRERDQSRERERSRAPSRTPGFIREETNETANSYTSTGGRSAKMVDPPVFCNDKARDTVSFASWLRQIKNKLRVNADHFLSDDAKMAYIEGRLGGKASEDLEPYLNKTHCEPIETSAALLLHLYNEYHDHQAADRAIEAFNTLELKAGGDYGTFKNTFVRLAGERGLKRSEWKGEFKRRLPASLQVALASSYHNSGVDFETYARMGADISFSYQQANANRDKEKAKADRTSASGSTSTSTNNRRGGRSGRSSTTATSSSSGAGTSSNSSGAPRKELTKDEIVSYIREGRCLSCHELGHTRRDCPNGGRKDKEALEARINEIAKEMVKKRAARAATVNPDNSEAEN